MVTVIVQFVRFLLPCVSWWGVRPPSPDSDHPDCEVGLPLSPCFPPRSVCGKPLFGSFFSLANVSRLPYCSVVFDSSQVFCLSARIIFVVRCPPPSRDPGTVPWSSILCRCLVRLARPGGWPSRCAPNPTVICFFLSTLASQFLSPLTCPTCVSQSPPFLLRNFFQRSLGFTRLGLLHIPTHNWANEFDAPCAGAPHFAILLLTPFFYCSTQLHGAEGPLRPLCDFVRTNVQSPNPSHCATKRFRSLDLSPIDFLTFPWADLTLPRLFVFDEASQRPPSPCSPPRIVYELTLASPVFKQVHFGYPSFIFLDTRLRSIFGRLVRSFSLAARVVPPNRGRALEVLPREPPPHQVRDSRFPLAGPSSNGRLTLEQRKVLESYGGSCSRAFRSPFHIGTLCPIPDPCLSLNEGKCLGFPPT